MSKDSKKSKYVTQVRTAEQIAKEEAEAAQVTVNMEDEADEPIIVKSEKATKESMMELTAMAEKLSLEKQNKRKRKSKKDDADMTDVDAAKAPKIQIRSKAIQKKKDKQRFKKSRKQLLH